MGNLTVPLLGPAKSIILNTKSLVFETRLLVFDTRFLVSNTKFMIHSHVLARSFAADDSMPGSVILFPLRSNVVM